MLFFRLAVSCLFMLTGPVSAQFTGGTGTTADPFLVSTVAQLDNIRLFPDSSFALVNDLDFAGSAYDSANTADHKGWLPLGDGTTPFTGTFNGRGHAVRHLFIERTAGYTADEDIGLFGCLGGAVLESVTVESCTVKGYRNVGGLAGRADSSSISHCSAGGYVRTAYYAGMLIGSNSSSVSSCLGTGDVEATSSSSYAGGLTGSNAGTLTDCRSTACVLANMYAGGLTGKNTGSIERCYATGSVTGSSYLGGLTGSNEGMIRNSYAVGTVAGTNYTGGLAGLNKDTVRTCFSTGEVTAAGGENGGLVGFGYSGGTVISGFWDTGTSGKDVSSGGAGRSTVLMKQLSTYTDSSWNFSTVWEISNGISYPGLQALPDMPVAAAMYDTLAENGATTLAVQVCDAEGGTVDSVYIVTPCTHGSLAVSGTDITYIPDSAFYGIDRFTWTAAYADGRKSNDAAVHCLVSPYENGSGSASSPLEISDVYQLDAVRYLPDMCFAMVQDVDLAGTVFDSSNSTDHKGWDPVAGFTGSFNGRGHRISNLYINRPDKDNIGLFADANDAVICSTGIQECRITGSFYTGALAGGCVDSTAVSDCHATGSVAGEYGVGGLVGKLSNYASVNRCYAVCDVYGSSQNAGGLLGYVRDYCSVSDAYATGTVAGNRVIAGLIGWFYWNCTAENCYAAGPVSGNGSVAGLINSDHSTVTDCFWDSLSTGQASSGGVGAGKTTAEMQAETTYTDAGWDFGSVWEIRDGISYPGLQGQDDMPAAFSCRDTVAEGGTADITLHGADPEGATIDSYVIVSAPVHGTAVLNDSVATYTPDSTFSGPDRFSFQVVDSAGRHSNTALVRIMVTPVYAGNGTAGDPYQIVTMYDLNGMRWNPDKHYVLSRDLDVTGSDFDSSHSENNSGWDPVGQNGNAFTGSLDGQGHVIKNLYLNRPGGNCLGLFGYVSGARIDSLGLENCRITGSDTVGCLAGHTSGGTAISCSYATGTVNGAYAVGGMTGFTDSSSLFDCYSLARVAATSKAGGLVGFHIDSSLIQRCYSTGSVSGFSQVGGLVGQNAGAAVSNSFWDTQTSGRTSSSGGTGKTTAEMMTLTTFTDTATAGLDSAWDFAGTWYDDGQTADRWCLDDGISYPHFRYSSVVLAYGAGPHGNVTGDTLQYPVAGGGGTDVTAVPDTGYHFVQWSDGVTDNPRQDTAVGMDTAVAAVFAIDSFTVSYRAGAHGTLTGDTVQTVAFGADGMPVTVVPDTGYHFVQWSDGVTDNPRQDTAVAMDMAVNAVFAIDSFTVSYHGGASGTVAGDTAQAVPYGADGTPVTAVADTGHHFVQWSDGVTDNPRQDTAVTGDVSVNAEFAINQYTVAVLADSHGTVLPTGDQTVVHGDSLTVSATADTHYHFVCWTATGGLLLSDSLAANARIVKVTGSGTVTAFFAIDTFIVHYQAGGNGSLQGDTLQVLDYGADGTAVTAVPDTGYHFAQWSDGLTDNPRQDTAVSGDASVSAVFAIDSFAVVVRAGTLGTVIPSGSQTVAYGGSLAVSALADSHCHFAGWSASGGLQLVDSLAADTRVVRVGGNGTVTARFTVDTVMVRYLAGTDGTLLGDTLQVLDYGMDGTAVTAVPDTGYHFVQWSDGLTDNPRQDSAVHADTAVSAVFAVNEYVVTVIADPNGNVSPAGGQAAAYGGSLAITATADSHYVFVCWITTGGLTVDDDSSASTWIRNVTGDGTVTALFTANVGIDDRAFLSEHAPAVSGTYYTMEGKPIDASRMKDGMYLRMRNNRLEKVLIIE